MMRRRFEFFIIAVSVVLALLILAKDAQARPAKWCGWYMRTQVHRDPGPAYNLARNWARFGSRASGPAVGVIVVWWRHVGKIVGFDRRRGQWIVHSGNDGGRVRSRPRAVHNAIAFRWP